MAEAGYKQLISYKLALIAFELGWDFVPRYYKKIEDSRQRDQIKQARRPARQLCSTSRVRIVLKRRVVNLGGSHKQNIVEGSSERSLSSKLKLYDVSKSSGMEALEDFEDILRFENLPRWDKDDPRLKKLHQVFESYPPNPSNPSPPPRPSVKAVAEVLEGLLLLDLFPEPDAQKYKVD